MKKSHKVILIAIIVLVVVGLVGTFSNFTGTRSTGRRQPSQTQVKRQVREPTTAELQVQRSQDNKSIGYSGFEGKTALELLRFVGHVETKTFGELGQMVTAIDGLKSDEKHFWAFYVNGKLADTGADKYQTEADEKIEWKYEEIK